MTNQCLTTSAWPTPRILFLLAGTVTLVSAVLAATVTPWFLLLTGAVGVNQLLLVATGTCPASLVIDRLKRHGVGSPSSRTPEQLKECHAPRS
jgi:hypothetical protein